MNRQLCASCYVVDFDNKELLLMYNRKLGLWLQPGGHIEESETPLETARREVIEETGVEPEFIGHVLNNNIEPIAVEIYETKIGPMLDIQYMAIPKYSKEIKDTEGNSTRWVPLDEVISSNEISNEIKEKFNFILKHHKR